MKKILALAAFLATSLCLQAQIKFTPNPAMPLPDNIKLYYNSSLADYTGRFPHMQPVWFIWADGPCTAGEAETLVDRMGLNSTLKDYVGMMVVVFSPVNGKDYSKKEDFEAYKTLFENPRFHKPEGCGHRQGRHFCQRVHRPRCIRGSKLS